MKPVEMSIERKCELAHYWAGEKRRLFQVARDFRVAGCRELARVFINEAKKCREILRLLQDLEIP